MFLLKMAWRNLWKNRRRTLIAVSAITGGLIISIFFTGLANGIYSDLIDSSCRLGPGHIAIQKEGENGSHGIRDYISLKEEFTERVKGLKGVEYVLPRVSGEGILSTGYDSSGIHFMGVSPPDEERVSPLPEKIISGRFLHKGDERGILLGDELAGKLKVTRGSKVVLTTTDTEGNIVSELFRVSGIFRTGTDYIDGYFSMINIPLARRMLKIPAGGVTRYSLFLKGHREVERVMAKLREIRRTDMEILPWKVIMPELASYIRMDSGGNYIMQFLIFLIIAAGIFNTILMSVLERRREFGVIVSLGMRPSDLLKMVILESLLLGLCGILAGGTLGLLIDHYFSIHGIPLSLFMKEGFTISYATFQTYLFSGIYPDYLAGILGGVLLFSTLLGIYPAWIAARTNPAMMMKG